MRDGEVNPTMLTPSPRDRLIVALDTPSVAEADTLVAKLKGHVGVFKIGLELAMAGGIAFAEKLAADGLPVFLDMKLLDIGHTVQSAAASVARLDVRFLTVHASDRKTLDAAVAGRGDSNLKLLAVTVLTNLSSADLRQQGVTTAPDELVLKRACMAADAGFDGVVASGGEAAAIRQAVGPDMLIVTPGIRPTGSAVGDQARVTTPADAISSGADYLVVGRPITQAADPVSAADAIVNEIASAD